MAQTDTIMFWIVIGLLFVSFILLLSNAITTDKIDTDKEFSDKKQQIIALLYTTLALLILSIIATVYLYYSYNRKFNMLWDATTGYNIIN